MWNNVEGILYPTPDQVDGLYRHARRYVRLWNGILKRATPEEKRGDFTMDERDVWVRLRSVLRSKPDLALCPDELKCAAVNEMCRKSKRLRRRQREKKRKEVMAYKDDINQFPRLHRQLQVCYDFESLPVDGSCIVFPEIGGVEFEWWRGKIPVNVFSTVCVFQTNGLEWYFERYYYRKNYRHKEGYEELYRPGWDRLTRQSTLEGATGDVRGTFPTEFQEKECD